MQRPIHLKSQIFVPDSVVGVLIGVKGSNIKNMIFATGASIRIDGKKVPKAQNDTVRESSDNVLSQSASELSVKENDGAETKSLREDTPTSPRSPSTLSARNQHIQEPGSAKKSPWKNGNKSDGRFVAISGYDFQVYKAQSWVFQAIAETKNICLEELVLTAETMVPSTIVGRIIGREGRNIKELRRLVQAIIYIVESPDDRKKSLLYETSVRIVGNVFCLQTVQMHFARLAEEVEQVEPCCPFYLNPSPDLYCPPVDAFMNPCFSATSLPMQRPIRLKSQIFVPDSVVGVLIGVKGSNIKNMSFATGASIRIDGKKIPKAQNDTVRESSENVLSQSVSKLSVKENDGTETNSFSEDKPTSPRSPSTLSAKNQHIQEPGSANSKKSPWKNGNKADGRFVAISGYDFQVYKAQSWVFQAIAETKNICLEELVLTAETMVPSTIVGRIIGREGRNIKELRRLVQAIIYIVESPDDRKKSLLYETPVRIVGDVFCLQTVQMHFARLAAEVEQVEPCCPFYLNPSHDLYFPPVDAFMDSCESPYCSVSNKRARSTTMVTEETKN